MQTSQMSCPLCGYKGTLFKPAGSVKTATGRRKLRACPSCDSDEWTRLAVAWFNQRSRLPRQSRVLALTTPIALRRFLSEKPGLALVDASTADLAAGVFAANSFDLVIIGENWSYESKDIAIATQLLDVLKARGWLLAMPRDREDAEHKGKQLAQLGFDDDTGNMPQREQIAVDPELPFLAMRKKEVKAAKPESTAEGVDNRFIWYREEGYAAYQIRPAPLIRDWMEATTEKYAYRCLPLNIANCAGWEILSPRGFTATWNGSTHKEAITITPDQQGVPAPAISHFGFGVMTFSIPGLLRTPQGIDLMVSGPVNRPKPGIQALMGIIETDWSEFGFTMNWMFTDKDRPIRFEADEPFCTLIPMPRTLAESLEPAIIVGDPNSDLWRKHMAHRLSRADFIKNLKIDGSLEKEKGWQRAYFSGPLEEVTPSHRTKVKLKPFRKMED
jgi:hypothetical protein